MINQEILMALDPEVAIKKLRWDSIEWLFKPTNVCELMLRLDLEGTKSKVIQWLSDAEVSPVMVKEVNALIKAEEFYLKLKELHEEEKQKSPC